MFRTMPRLSLAFVAFAGSLSLGLPLLAEETRPAEARPVHLPLRLDRGPTIDGDLAEPCWQKAQPIIPLRENEKEPAKDKTEIRVCYDSQGVYFGADLYHPEMAKLTDRCKERDDEVCMDDSLEIFLFANPSSHQVYHWIINSTPVIYDGREHFTETGAAFSSAWNGHIQAATRRHADRWSLEVAVPFASLELAPGTQPVWQLGLLANRLGRNRYQWWPHNSKFTTAGPPALGDLPLAGVSFDGFYYAVRDLRLVTWLTGDDRPRLMLSGQVHALAGASQNAEIVAQATAPSGKQFEAKQPVPLEPSSARPFALQLPAEEKGKYQLLCTLRDTRSGLPYAIHEDALPVSDQPLSLVLVRPSYRSALFSKMKDKTVRAEAVLHLDPAIRSQYALEFRLTRQQDGQECFSTRVEDLKDGAARLEKDVQALPDGTYLLAAKLLKKASGQTVGTAMVRVRKLLPADLEVWFEDQKLFINGKPTFLRALCGTNPAEYFVRISLESGFNVCTDGHTCFLKGGEFLPLLEKHEAWFVPPTRPPWYQKVSGTPLPADITPDERKAIETWRKDYFDHPRMLGYKVGDEPDIHPQISIHSLKRGRDLMEDLDPYRLITMPLSSAGNWASERYDGIVDLRSGSDYLYPVYGEPGYQPIQQALESARMAISNGGWHPYMSGFQLFDSRCWDGRGVPAYPGRLPCFSEYRYMAYRLVQLGGVGIEWWAHSHDYTHPMMNPAGQEGVRAIVGELAYLEPVICEGQESEETRVVADKPDVTVWSRLHSGDLFVIAANNAPRPQKVKLTLPSGRKARKIHVLSEGRSLSVRGNALKDDFHVLGLHIYTTREPLPDDLPINRAFQDKLFTSVPVRVNDPKDLASERIGARAKGEPTAYISFPDLAAFAIDDDIRTCWFDGSFQAGWEPIHEVKDPAKRPFLTVALPLESTVSRATLQSWEPRCYPTDRRYIPRNYEIQVPEGTGWKTVAEVRNNASVLSAATFPPVKTRELRWLFHDGSILVAEVEIYK
jgi:hypothetical protein